MKDDATLFQQGYTQLGLLPYAPIPFAINFDDEHGEVFTRRWIVDLILDLVGYTSDRDLADLRMVEPACGTGAFLLPIVQRLSDSCRAHGRPLTDAASALRAFDLLPRSIDASRSGIAAMLEGLWPEMQVAAAVDSWLRVGDYLLTEDVEATDFVVGNPPYIRIEDVPDDRMRAYRRACQSMVGRADIYVGFYEKALRSLAPGGKLGFICADRWMRNQYGRLLRDFVSRSYSVDTVITMHDVDAFEDQVAAYPAVTVLSRRAQAAVQVVETTRQFGPSDARQIVQHAQAGERGALKTAAFQAAQLPHWFSGTGSWPTGSPEQLAILEYLNDNFPPLEDVSTGTRVGIGVATGADDIFVASERIAVEPDRLLPLSMVRDLRNGTFDWSGHYLVNPWADDGDLVPLAQYPLLADYFERHRPQLAKRYVAGKAPSKWYKTIDKVDPALRARPKLLIPDMRMTIHPVLDEGSTYPHHNLYYVVSDTWDMRVLGGLLMSRVAQAFIEAYAVKMRGGTLRFQAQYLRRIRVPRQTDLAPEEAAALRDAFVERDVEAATRVARRVFKLKALEI